MIQEEIKENEQQQVIKGGQVNIVNEFDDDKALSDEEKDKGCKWYKRDPTKQRKPFRIACKNVFLTYPRNQSEPEVLLEFLKHKFKKWDPTFISTVRELHKDGFPHLHAIVLCKKQTEIGDALNYLGHPIELGINAGSIRKLGRALKYIEKQTQSIEWGEKPKVGTGEGSKAEICKLAIEEFRNTGKVDYIKIVTEQPESLMYVDKLKQNLALVFKQESIARETIGRRCIMVIGESGVGKTHGVREFIRQKKQLEQFESTDTVMYLKEYELWWQGYTGQEFVLIDDIDQRNVSSIWNALKQWMDKFQCWGRQKNIGGIGLGHRILFLTSQYTLEEICNAQGGDSKLVDALTRRVFMIDVRDEGSNWEWWIKKNELELKDMTKEEIIAQKRECIKYTMEYFEKKIEFK